jgi:hypothetical protein
MKAEIIKSVLQLSIEELNEAMKIKEHLCKIAEKDFKINYISVGFAFFEVSVYANYTDYIYRIKQDGTTIIQTCFDLIQVSNEVGEILLNEVRERKQYNKYIDLRIIL